jgi:hypothetical protein
VASEAIIAHNFCNRFLFFRKNFHTIENLFVSKEIAFGLVAPSPAQGCARPTFVMKSPGVPFTQ